MNISLSALLVAALSRLPIAAEWALLTGAQLAPVQEPASLGPEREGLGDPVAVVQVELLPDLEEAEQLAASIERTLGGDGEFDVFVEEVPGDTDELPLSYRVNVGPFDSFEAAERARAELETAGIPGFVRELEPVLGC